MHPEMPVEFYGPEASEFTEKSLTRQWVRLEFEPGDQIDVYGRLLAYIFLEDGTLFNGDLVHHGYARTYTRFPFRYEEEFRLAEIEARNIGRGLWVRQKREATSAHPLEGKIIGNRRSKVFHVPGQANYGRVSEESRVYFDTEEEAARSGYRRAKRLGKAHASRPDPEKSLVLRREGGQGSSAPSLNQGMQADAEKSAVWLMPSVMFQSQYTYVIAKEDRLINEMALIGFVWNAISGNVIGNAAYDGVKAILGKGFNRLASYAKENKKNDFKIALQAFPCGFRFAI
jgi:micrococcal nuclease